MRLVTIVNERATQEEEQRYRSSSEAVEVLILETWLLFLYKVPHEPSSRRVYVWRKLRRLGAVMLQDAAWALPMMPSNLEQLKKLAGEVTELGGDALLWEGHLAIGEQDKTLVRALLAEVKVVRSEAPVEVE